MKRITELGRKNQTAFRYKTTLFFAIECSKEFCVHADTEREMIELLADYYLENNLRGFYMTAQELDDLVDNPKINQTKEQIIKNDHFRFCPSRNIYIQVDSIEDYDIATRKEVALNNMDLMYFPSEVRNKFHMDNQICHIHGSEYMEISKETYPELYQQIKKIESQNATVYGVFTEPSTYGLSTNYYIILYVQDNNPIVNTVIQKDLLTRVIAIGWQKGTNLTQTTVACIQSSRNGVWCIPYSMTKNLSFDVYEKENHAIHT